MDEELKIRKIEPIEFDELAAEFYSMGIIVSPTKLMTMAEIEEIYPSSEKLL